MARKHYLAVIIIMIIVACGQESPKPKVKKLAAKKTELKKEKERNEVAASKTYEKKKKFNKAGAKLFILCSACHSLKKDGVHKVGPNLHAFMGKKAGIREGFKYTESLKSADITWDEKTLRAWIENPAKMVPGTSMAFIGIKQKDRQDDLIEYLVEQTK